MPPSPQNPMRPSFVSPLLAAVLFGLASGVVGALVVIAVAPTPAVIDATASALRSAQGRRPAGPSTVPVAVQAAANAAVE
ncbi:hypothetical protein HY633_00700, partial [Candidatus Uhrbacteria bacterium]|nr:hypothetical protein [Candidatus Uhrbacteria bacterium]